jgi:diguanylate cyclase (GGDEF)-like protein
MCGGSITSAGHIPRITDSPSPEGKRAQPRVASTSGGGTGGAGRVFPDRIVIHERAADIPPTDVQQLEVLTSWDPRTESATRAHFAELLRHELARPIGSTRRLAVLFAGIHGLAAVNATWGHETGIRVLSLVTGRLLDSLRWPNTLTRVGATQFAVICPDLMDAEQAMNVADRMRAATGAAIHTAGCHVTLSLSVSVGFAKYKSIQSQTQR